MGDRGYRTASRATDMRETKGGFELFFGYVMAAIIWVSYALAVTGVFWGVHWAISEFWPTLDAAGRAVLAGLLTLLLGWILRDVLRNSKLWCRLRSIPLGSCNRRATEMKSGSNREYKSI